MASREFQASPVTQVWRGALDPLVPLAHQAQQVLSVIRAPQEFLVHPGQLERLDPQGRGVAQQEKPEPRVQRVPPETLDPLVRQAPPVLGQRARPGQVVLMGPRDPPVPEVERQAPLAQRETLDLLAQRETLDLLERQD